jgi:dihydrofolate reductase
MRKLVLSMAVSLDGLVARPGRFGAGGWGPPPEDPALKQRKLDWFGNVDLHLMGRVTYEEMAGFWPTSDDPYAAPMNQIPKVVFSKTLERAEWADTQIARGELASEIAELKRQPGNDLLAWGGAAFAQSLSVLGLVDEYRLILQPVALGAGLPLFKHLSQPLRLQLVDAHTYFGAALHVYRPAPRGRLERHASPRN